MFQLIVYTIFICSVSELGFICAPSPSYTYIGHIMTIFILMCFRLVFCIQIFDLVKNVCFGFALFLSYALSALPQLGLPGILIDSKAGCKTTAAKKVKLTLASVIKCQIDQSSDQIDQSKILR